MSRKISIDATGIIINGDVDFRDLEISLGPNQSSIVPNLKNLQNVTEENVESYLELLKEDKETAPFIANIRKFGQGLSKAVKMVLISFLLIYYAPTDALSLEDGIEHDEQFTSDQAEKKVGNPGTGFTYSIVSE